MGLGETLLKVAIGVAIVKGVSTLGKGSAGGGTVNAGTGTPYGGGRPGTSGGLPGGLENVMRDALANAPAKRSGPSPDVTRTGDPAREGQTRGGLDDILDQIITGGTGRRQTPDMRANNDGDPFSPTARPPRQNAPKGGLEDLLGGMGGASGGGLGQILEAVLGGAGPTTLPEPKARQEELAAALALRAMLQAVKSDGTLDEAERRKLMDQMGEATEAEVAFVNAELQRPVDVDGLARQVPNGMEEQVYLVSLMAIDLDNQREATYLAALAKALELSPQEVNGLHDRMGAPRMYR